MTKQVAPTDNMLSRIRWLISEAASDAGIAVSVATVNKMADAMAEIMHAQKLLLIFESTWDERLREEDTMSDRQAVKIVRLRAKLAEMTAKKTEEMERCSGCGENPDAIEEDTK